MLTTQPITTAEQLFQAPDLGRCELLRGELIMMSPAGSEHGMIVAEIGGILRDFVEPRALGWSWARKPVFASPAIPTRSWRRTSRSSERIASATDLPEGYFPGAPDLAVEVLSPNDRAGEVFAKVQDWLAAGCASVWVVDPKTQTVTVYGADRKAVMLTSADMLTGGDLLPGFSAPVAGIFTM